MLRRLIETFLVLVFVLTLGGCDIIKDWFSSTDKKAKLKGDRIPVMLADQSVKPDPSIQDLTIELPKTQDNADWPQSGGNAAHDMQNLALGQDLKQIWRSSIGSGKSSEWKHLAAPILGDGRLYAMNTDSVVGAFDPKDGSRLWKTDLKPDGDVGDGDVGGGVAYGDGMLFATNNYGEALALNPKTGDIKWRRSLSGPTRAAPMVGGGRVFVMTADNQLHALNSKDGTVQWTHTGLSEVTGLLGAASPAYDGGVVIAPYTSGEIYALRADNGRELWSDTLAAVRRVDAIAGIADIRGNPVIDRDRVIAVGNSGRMVAIDLRSGGRAWEEPIGGITMPWVGGGFVFVVTNDNQLVCLTRQDGRVRWMTQLDRWENPEKKRDSVLWTGPVMAGGNLILASTNEKLILVSPLTGKITSTIDTDDPVSVSPIVANDTLYVLTDAGDLRAYR